MGMGVIGVIFAVVNPPSSPRPTAPDSDDDGVPDEEDAFPLDPDE
jgi:hypothetical protein